ncbi:hypothetical protein FRB90_007935 [Tulasnella sp. 427]|nr:hypothetical protein FRB90_007935 [Tulasnella sp. 427]
MTVRKLLDDLDATWYSKLNPRWMDLLGDYAGKEFFIIDGDSVIQKALNDPLLALGNSQDSSFQLLHAVWSVEQLISEFVTRRCNSEIVFFECNEDLTIYGGEDTSSFVVSSRRLARTVLKAHLERLPIGVKSFKAPSDDLWKSFVNTKQPMCILCNDGSQFATVDCPEITVSAVIMQRLFVFAMISNGVAVVSLDGTEFRGSKILSFVYEQNRLWASRDNLAPLLRQCREEALKCLPEPGPLRSSAQPGTSPQDVVEPWLQTAVERYLLSSPPETTNDALFTVFLLHMVVLPHIPIVHRSQGSITLHPRLESKVHNHVLPSIFDAMDGGLAEHGCQRRPDVDGRIFLNMVAFFTQTPNPDAEFAIIFGRGPANDIESVVTALQHHEEARRLLSSPAALSAALGRWRSDEAQSATPPSDQPILDLLPFHNDVFDECLKPIRILAESIPVTDTSGVTSSSSTTVGESDNASQRTGWFTNTTTFTDDQHWHNRRKITEGFQEKRLVLYGERREDDRPLSAKELEWQRKKRERRQQILMRDIHRHATTLTGAKGTPLQRMIIPLTKRSIKDIATQKVQPVQRRANPPGAQATSKPRKEPKLNSADKLRQRIKDEKAVKTLSESEIWWKQQLAQIDKLTTTERKEEYLSRVLKNAKRMEDPWLKTETCLYRIYLEVCKWIADDRGGDPPVQAGYSVTILRLATEIQASGVVSDAARTSVCSLLRTLGLADLDILKESSSTSESSKKPLTFQTVRFAHRDPSKPALYPFLRLPTHPINFQLEHYGVYMDRSMDGQADPRVSFVPDAWQRQVLDRLDRRESVLVVAPTSAGKTFISYYAMEQVLRESDDSVLVYVAPTKPLVNQIVAEISARFEKSLKSGTVWAAHTRDWRVHEPQKCQILVTVPEMLAIMLLSPVLANKWVPRIRWIILDEIHTIGQQDGGAVWEQLLLFAPCPIVGLSATIGNPEEFSRWLESVQDQHGFKYALIQHKHRYSHLRKFAYTMSREPIDFKGLSTNPPATVKPIYIHPISVLLSGGRALPEDLALESKDCLTLYQAMCQVAEDSPAKRERLAKLDPQAFFARSQQRMLTQKDVLGYEESLKSLLGEWSKENDAYENVLRPIGEALSQDHELCENLPTQRIIHINLIHLLHDLQKRDQLPAILFNFDRHECEVMACLLVKTLKSAETAWKESNPQWQAKLAKWEVWVAESKQRLRAAEREKKSKPRNDEVPGDTKSWEETFDPDEPLPDFSFAGPWSGYSKAEMEEDLGDLRWAGVQGWAMEALKLGIAVHHAGMNRKYRTLIESLFRVGFIRVVIATGTLALGINMPVKTSVFVGDSVYLTALTYRQCAGRAGRRGMDLLGNVVFYGIPMERIHRIMASKVPPLSGNMPLTTTLSLRLCSLLHGSQQASSAVNAINSVLRLPQLSLASDIGRDEVLHHLRFSIDYLRRSNLLSVSGEPLILFPVVAHLYHTEPSNLALVALLQGGVLHSVCDSIDLNPIKTKRDLVALLSHLFARRLLPRIYHGKNALTRLRPPKSPSKVILPPLSSEAFETLSAHNSMILETFRGYARSYAKQHLSSLPDNVLPLSKESIPNTTSSQEATFISILERKATKAEATSWFVANSGVTDTSLQTVSDLARTVRAGLYLDKNSIPGLDELLGLDGQVVNGYVLDYFTHGQVKALVEANRVRISDVWFALQDFSLALATLQTGLEHYLKASAADSTADTGSDSDDETDDWDENPNRESVKELEPGATSTFLEKPPGVTEGDWKVYRAVVLTKREFDEKWKAMWA